MRFPRKAGRSRRAADTARMQEMRVEVKAMWKVSTRLSPVCGVKALPIRSTSRPWRPLYSNSEATHFLAYGPASASSKVDSGVFPESTRTYGLTSGQIGNSNFVAIPYNSPNKAATRVTADFLLSLDAQLHKAYPDV